MTDDEPRRLDVELVRRGLMVSRAQARAAIRARYVAPAEPEAVASVTDTEVDGTRVFCRDCNDELPGLDRYDDPSIP